jgi:hypothetical protein
MAISTVYGRGDTMPVPNREIAVARRFAVARDIATPVIGLLRHETTNDAGKRSLSKPVGAVAPCSAVAGIL